MDRISVYIFILLQILAETSFTVDTSDSSEEDNDGCHVEVGYGYPGTDHLNKNDGDDKKPDMSSCRSFCRSKDVDYFVWRGPYSPGSGRERCYCKTALPPEKKVGNVDDVYSGVTMCDGG